MSPDLELGTFEMGSDVLFFRDRPFSMGFPSFPMLGFPDHRQHDPREQQRGRERVRKIDHEI